MKRTALFVNFLLVLVAAHDVGAETIHLGKAEFDLEAGERVSSTFGEEPFIVQFDEVPGAPLQEALLARGVILDRYVGASAYVIRCHPECASWLPDESVVRATTRITREMKLPRLFETRPELVRRTRANLPMNLDLVFFDDVPFERAEKIVREAGTAVGQAGFSFRSSISVETTWQNALELLGRPEIRWIEPSLPEAIPLTINAGERVRADHVREQSEFLGADGSGTRVGIWDWFPDHVHTDMEDRVRWANVIPGQHSHGQLVSGVLAGAGLLDHRAKGIAPGAELYWHTCDRRTVWEDMSSIRSAHGVTITNNSWGIPIGWWSDPGDEIPTWEDNGWAFGYYHELAAGADDLVRSDDLLLVFATGNSREYGFLGPHFHSSEPNPERLRHDVHPPNPDFGSVNGPAVAKNALTVGYTTKDELITLGSMWGPTLDGRVKPDLVAPGLDLLVTDADDGYMLASGSSLSAPVVAGAAALLSDYSRRQHGITPSSLEIKNLLIHSARDLGQSGPDYSYGFGLIDVELAARILRSGSFGETAALLQAAQVSRRRAVGHRADDSSSSPPLFRTDLIDDGQTRSFQFSVRNHSPALRATLAWHDPPGSVLVNDLDLRLVGPDGSIVRPFVLDPSNPSAPASRGRNAVDNVESIVVDDPAPGIWTVIVEGSRVALAPEQFSLIVSAVDGNAPLFLRHEGQCVKHEFFLTKDDGTAVPLTPSTTFTANDPLNVFFAIGIPENADYGDYYGSIGLLGSIRSSEGEILMNSQNQTHQLPAVERVDTVATGLSIPVGLPEGDYFASLSVMVRNGRECTAEYMFTVEH